MKVTVQPPSQLSLDTFFKARAMCISKYVPEMEPPCFLFYKNTYEKAKEFWKKEFNLEHSTLEVLNFPIVFEEMPKSVVAQLVRGTTFHPRHFVQSSRPDWTDKPRDPNQLIGYITWANPKSMIYMARQRLCNMAEKQTHEAILLLKKEMKKFDTYSWKVPFFEALCLAMVPNCVYRGGQCVNIGKCSKEKK